MTPTEILEEIIEERKYELKNCKSIFYRLWIDMQMDILKRAKERIEKECTILLSDWDNSYNIPYYLQKKFEKDMVCEFQEDSDWWYDWCDEFDKKYSKYKI